jgi:hypothetical protein
LPPLPKIGGVMQGGGGGRLSILTRGGEVSFHHKCWQQSATKIQFGANTQSAAIIQSAANFQSAANTQSTATIQSATNIESA